MHRPDMWAQPITVPGVDNLFRVNHELYRSAQPTHEGMESLKALGIKTIINLRWLHSDSDELKGVDLFSDARYMTAWHINDADALWFLDMVTTPEGAPFLVHCQHGADRTGAMVAMYRMVYQGWKKKEAIKELQHGRFGFHEIWWNIPRYLEYVNIDRIKEKLQTMGGR